MKNRPILFSTPMVQAILDGRKTMTRRVVKPQPPDKFSNFGTAIAFVTEKTLNHTIHCPYGQPGDVLWVRETWCVTQPFHPESYHFGYKTGVQPYSDNEASEKYDFAKPGVWKPSIHMPKEACRIFLRVKNVRVERLKEISTEDCIAEGLSTTLREHDAVVDLKDQWEYLWTLINGYKSWDANPWVWVIEFERISREEAGI